MFSMATDAAIMLTKDKTLRTELAKGLRSVPVTEHIKRSFDFGQVIIKLVIAQIAGKAFRGFTFAFGGLFGMPKILFKFAFGKRKKLRTVMGCSLTEPEEGFRALAIGLSLNARKGAATIAPLLPPPRLK